MLTNPLRDRFGIVARLEFYSPEELALLETLSAKMRIFRVPEFLATAFLLAVIGLLVHMLLAR